MTLHFGKSSTRYPEQIENKFYARGKKESDRYCGLKKGDHVFSIFNGKADRL